MEILDIRVFLDIVRSRNITRTAEHLFLSQSHVSKSLQRLESEIGFHLLERGRGKHGIELTALGKSFLPLAERYLVLHSEIETLKEYRQHSLRIAVLESVYFEYLRDFLKTFEKEHTDIRLSIQIKDSVDVYSKVENEIVDYGFAAYSANYDMLDIQPVYQQEWCIARYAEGAHEPVAVLAEELDPALEISFLCGDFDNLEQWRSRFFEHHHPGGIEVNGMMSALDFLKEPGRWALSTRKYIETLRRTEDLQILLTDGLPQNRTIYSIYNRKRHKREIDVLFEKEFLDFIKNSRE